MFSGSEDTDQFDTDAYTNARKINSYGQVGEFNIIILINKIKKLTGSLRRTHTTSLSFSNFNQSRGSLARPIIETVPMF